MEQEIYLGDGISLRTVSTNQGNVSTPTVNNNPITNNSTLVQAFVNALQNAIMNSGVGNSSLGGSFANISKFFTLRINGNYPNQHRIYLGGDSLFGSTVYDQFNTYIASDSFLVDATTNRPINQNIYNSNSFSKLPSNWQIDEFPELTVPFTSNSVSQFARFVASNPTILTGVRMIYDGSIFTTQQSYPIKFIDTVKEDFTTEIYEYSQHKTTLTNMANNSRAFDFPFGSPQVVDARRAMELTIQNGNFIGQVQIGYADFARLINKKLFNQFVANLK